MSDRDRGARPDQDFWKGTRILLTGHTGFKGAWMALWLDRMGAVVTGLALPAEDEKGVFVQARVDKAINSVILDLRDRSAVETVIADRAFDIVLHLAAQPLVRAAIADPVGTIATNVMGTAHLLEALRGRPALRAVVAVTTDKVYANDDSGRAFTEGDALGGKDPYAASKAATELVCASFARSYFDQLGVPVATARGGNVIGGGDYSRDRIVADIIRAVEDDREPRLRHPEATRPWQHVLDCVAGYLVYAERLCTDPDAPRVLNFGPRSGSDPVKVARLADAILQAAGSTKAWLHEPDPASLEAKALTIDTSLAREALGFESKLDPETAVEWTVAWHRAVWAGDDARAVTLNQIARYEALA